MSHSHLAHLTVFFFLHDSLFGVSVPTEEDWPGPGRWSGCPLISRLMVRSQTSSGNVETQNTQLQNSPEGNATGVWVFRPVCLGGAVFTPDSGFWQQMMRFKVVYRLLRHDTKVKSDSTAPLTSLTRETRRASRSLFVFAGLNFDCFVPVFKHAVHKHDLSPARRQHLIFSALLRMKMRRESRRLWRRLARLALDKLQRSSPPC